MGDTDSRIVSLKGPATESTNGEYSSLRPSNFGSVLRIVSHLHADEKRVSELTRPEAAVCDGLDTRSSENMTRRNHLAWCSTISYLAGYVAAKPLGLQASSQA